MEIDPKYTLFHASEKNLRHFGEFEMTKVVEVCKESAIKAGDISIVALPGVPAEVSDYLDNKRNTWTDEPYPGIEDVFIKDNQDEMKALELSSGGEDYVWKCLEETADKIFKNTGKELFLEMLTPYQAVYLIGELVKERLNYEYLITDQGVKEIESGVKIETCRPDLVQLFKKDINEYYVEVKKLEENMDLLKADEILKLGFGTCRHFAAIASATYRVIKEKQLGTLLNGTYLIYHAENVGKQVNKAVVGLHAYNILMVTSPEKTIDFSVVDTTEATVNDQLDYTWRRMSQICSFFSEYGALFVDEDPEEIVESLAREAYTRLAKYFDRKKLKLESRNERDGVLSFIDDYISLIDQGVVGKTGGTIEHITTLLKLYGCSRHEALMTILRTAAYNFSDEGLFPSIRRTRTKEINNVLKTVDFGSTKLSEALELYYTMSETLESYDVTWINSLDKRDIEEEDLEYLQFVLHFARASLDLGKKPENSNVHWKLLNMLRSGRKRKIFEADDLFLVEKYLLFVK